MGTIRHATLTTELSGQVGAAQWDETHDFTLDAVDLTFTQSGTGAVARTVHGKLLDTVSVKDFGATGDGVTDDTAAVQAALDSGADVVVFPAGTYRWAANGPTVKSNTVVRGEGAIIVQPNAHTGATISTGTEYVGFRLDCGTTNVVIEGFDFRGPYYGITCVPAYRSVGINISGRYDQYFYNNANYPSNPTTAVSGTSQNITLRNNQFNGWGQSAVIADQIDQFYCRNNRFVNCTRDGVRMYGVKYFDVSHNYIREMAPGFTTEGTAPNYNVYGVTATRIYHCTAADGTLTDYRASAFGIIGDNIVRDCPTWKALDTHGGTDIVFSGNVIENAHIGIGVDKGGFNTADGYAPPRRIKIVDNHIVADASNTAGNRCGIFCVAEDETANNIGQDLIISDNYVTGYGEQTKDGNIVVSNYQRGSITGNVIVGGLRSGINFQNRVEDFSVRGGVIANVGITTAPFLAGISVAGVEQRVSIDGVTFIKSDTADTMNAVSTVSPSAGYGVKMGDGNTFQGTVTPAPSPGHLVVDSPYLTRTVAFGNINNNGATASIAAGRGIASVSRTGVGTVEVTLDETLALANSISPVVMGKGSDVLCYVATLTTSVITVSTRTATTAAAVDAGFFIQVNGY